MSTQTSTEVEPVVLHAALNRILERLKDADDTFGGFTLGAVQAYAKSVTLTVRFDNEADPFKAGEFADTLVRAPGLLADACRRLIAATPVPAAETGAPS